MKHLHPNSLRGSVRAPESRIEWMMYDALRSVASYGYGFDIASEDRGLGEPLTIEPQAEIGRYRVDFLVGMAFGSSSIRIAVECDGHEFHERTKLQASRDKRRDRTLQRKGYLVFRFTGSDIFNDSRGCADDVMQTIMDWLSKQAHEAYLHG